LIAPGCSLLLGSDVGVLMVMIGRQSWCCGEVSVEPMCCTISLARRRRWCFRSRQIDSLVVPAGRGTLSPLIAVSSVKNGRILWRLRSSESLGRSRREFLRLSNLTKVCPLVPPSRESVIRLDDREGRELGPLLQFPLRLSRLGLSRDSTQRRNPSRPRRACPQAKRFGRRCHHI